MNRTDQQQHFISTILAAANDGGGRNFCLRARAGTGKTSTVLELVDDYAAAFPAHEITLCAFGAAAAKELKDKLTARGHNNWRQIQAATIHSLGFNLLKFLFKSQVDGNKVHDLIDAQNATVYAEHSTAIARLVSYAKLEGFGFFPDAQIGDTHAWYHIAEHYDINGFDDTTHLDQVVAAAQHIYTLSLAKTDVVDFDDMVLFPLVKNIRVRFQKDLLVVDEAQDTGRARQALVRKFIKPTGTLIVVGDDRQGIFGFAGAQADALEQLITGLSMEILPLTMCWRCPRAVIREAQRIVPDIEAPQDAPEGEVLHLNTLPPPTDLLPTDAILCRNTAPLVETAYRLIRKGVACRVEGRDIGKGLITLVNRWKVTSIDRFLTKLSDYRARETQKALAKNDESKAAAVNDKCDTLEHIAAACLEQKKTQVTDMVAFVEALFADDVTGCLTLCTAHRSKGREWKRVFLLHYTTLCPSPWAKQAWQQRQEKNLMYVMLTRARETLVYVQ